MTWVIEFSLLLFLFSFLRVSQKAGNQPGDRCVEKISSRAARSDSLPFLQFLNLANETIGREEPYASVTEFADFVPR